MLNNSKFIKNNPLQYIYSEIIPHLLGESENNKKKIMPCEHHRSRSSLRIAILCALFYLANTPYN